MNTENLTAKRLVYGLKIYRCAILNDMATFDQAGIDDGYLDEIREGDKFTVEGAK